MVKNFETFYTEQQREKEDGIKKILQIYRTKDETGTTGFSANKNNALSAYYNKLTELEQEIKKHFDAGKIKYSESVQSKMDTDCIFLGNLALKLEKYKNGEWEQLNVTPISINHNYAKLKSGYPVEITTSVRKLGFETVDVKFTTKTDVYGTHYTVVDFADD